MKSLSAFKNFFTFYLQFKNNPTLAQRKFHMRKFYILLLIASAFLLQLCTTKKKAQETAASSSSKMKVTYVADIQPLVVKHCSPCHIPPGKKEPLNTFAAVKHEIDEVIESIQKNPGQHGFMPAKHSKLSDSTINVFVQWKKTGMQEM